LLSKAQMWALPGRDGEHRDGQIRYAGGAEADVGCGQARIDLDHKVVPPICGGPQDQIHAYVAADIGQTRFHGPASQPLSAIRQIGPQGQPAAEVAEPAVRR
jgi:hypothetical protein